MLNINSELLENIELPELIPVDTDSLELTNILKNYNLEEEKGIVNTIENQYLALTNLTIKFYLSKKETPLDIKKLIKTDFNYKVFLLKFIKEKMKRVVEENSIFLFKEILTILNLLSFGEKYNLLNSDNMLSIENIKILLDNYEKIVCEEFLQKEKDSFNLNFQFYLALIDLLNEVCIITALDIHRKKSIPLILELITNTISNLKNKIEIGEIYKKQLNFILGKQLLYFTNISYILIDKKDRELIVQKYIFMLNRILHGFDFLNKDENYYPLFLDRITSLILTLLYKLQHRLHIDDEVIKNSKYLNEIYNIYNRSVKEKHQTECDNLNQFRENLLKNYSFIYKHSVDNNFSGNIADLLDYLITLDEISTAHLEVINNIVLYSYKIEKDKLDQIIEFLLNKNRFNNNYYEFYKLKIIDRVIQRYISLKIETAKNNLISKIVEYIERSDLVSHLMSMYGKIYLSLSLYFSYENSAHSQEESRRFYFIYERLNSNSLESEFDLIRKQIFCNYAKNYFFNKVQTKITYTKAELNNIGKDLIDDYIRFENSKIKNDFYSSCAELIKDILEMKEPNDSWLFKELEELITNKIFFNLAKAKIETHNSSKYEIDEIGYDFEVLKLHEDYILKLYYSTFYKKAFMYVFENNRDFIKIVAVNIFKSYLNSIPSYTDIVTKLPNIKKLNSELKKYGETKIRFFEIYLNALVDFSESYNIEISNEFFRFIAQTINEKVDAYRLFGPKIGFIVNENMDYKELIKYLQKLTVKFEDEEINIKATIAVTYGEANKILEKSFFALSSAKISNDRVYIYE